MTSLKNTKCGFLMTLVILLISQNLYAQAWQSDFDWSVEWENKYILESNSTYSGDFCLKNSVYTYCSATPYQKRAHFAFKNRLPFRIYNPHRDSWITNNSPGPWDVISDPQEKILTFLRFISQSVVAGVNHIGRDTYPVKYEKIRIGDIFVSYEPHGHVETVTKIYSNGLIELSSSTVRSIGKLQEEASRLFLNDSPPECDHFDHCGFRRFYPLNQFHQTIEALYSSNYLDGQSRQQWLNSNYSKEKLFFSSVAQELSHTQQGISPHAIMHLTFKYIRSYVASRVSLIEEAEKHMKDNGYFSDNSPAYDLYSTDNRDRRNLFLPALSLVNFIKNISPEPIHFLDYWLNKEKNITLNYNINMNFKDFFFFTLIDAFHESHAMNCDTRKFFSTNPNVPTYLRWPLDSNYSALNPLDKKFEPCRDAIMSLNRSSHYSGNELEEVASILRQLSIELVYDLVTDVINEARSSINSSSQTNVFNEYIESKQFKDYLEDKVLQYADDKISSEQLKDAILQTLNNVVQN